MKKYFSNIKNKKINFLITFCNLILILIKKKYNNNNKDQTKTKKKKRQ